MAALSMPRQEQTILAISQGFEENLRIMLSRYISKVRDLFKFFVLFLLLGPFSVAAAQPPLEQRFSETEQAIKDYRSQLSSYETRLIRSTAWKKRGALSPSIRDKYEVWHQLASDQEKWAAAVRLKQDLITLQAQEKQALAAVQLEADRISYEIIKVLYQKRAEWRMMDSAIINNMLINMKIKERGFCWHWVETFMAALYSVPMEHYRKYWGVAYKRTGRENNSLVLTAAGQAFEEGIMIDAWRSSGKPFWRITKQDRFPWTPRTDVRVAWCNGKPCTVATEEWVDEED